jgi:riboflavin synthase
MKSGDGVEVTVAASRVLEGTARGDSISVNGACLTVTDFSGDWFSVFASRITCEMTTVGSVKQGDRVNLERALALGSRMGGHIVQGHVDCVGRIDRIRKEEKGVDISIIIDEESMRYVVPKGSIAVDGISLTVVSVGKHAFHLYLIPETMTTTVLKEKKAGDSVNVETDILAKYIARILEGKGKSGSHDDSRLKEKLMEEGFM